MIWAISYGPYDISRLVNQKAFRNVNRNHNGPSCCTWKRIHFWIYFTSHLPCFRFVVNNEQFIIVSKKVLLQTGHMILLTFHVLMLLNWEMKDVTDFCYQKVRSSQLKKKCLLHSKRWLIMLSMADAKRNSSSIK